MLKIISECRCSFNKTYLLDSSIECDLHVGIHIPNKPEHLVTTGLPAAAEHQAMDDDDLLYLELRAEAALHAKLRAENFMKAAHARSKKQYEVAQYYAQQVSGCSHSYNYVGVV